TSGSLTLTFTDANGQIPTSVDMNNIVQQITYTNPSDNPPANVQLNWTFDDGNSASAQGTGGVLTDLGIVIVRITAVNDAPAILGDPLVTNGEFGTGDLTGWTSTGNVDNDGTQVRFGQVGGANGTLSQTLTTAIGQTYVVTFDYGDRSVSQSQSLNVAVAGSTTLLNRDIITGTTANSITGYTYQFIADSTATTITFADTSSDHSGVRGYLDNVSVAAELSAAGTVSYNEND
ncbi:unnamed protein product, partial [Hapterophycus canaliculatus]